MIKRIKNASKYYMDKDILLNEIATLTSQEEANYYKKHLHPKNAMHKYGNSTYIALLEEVKHQILIGCRSRTSKETVLANARIKVLT